MIRIISSRNLHASGNDELMRRYLQIEEAEELVAESKAVS